MRPQHGLAFALLGIETDLTRVFADVLSWFTETSPHHILKTSLDTVINRYFQGLILTASIYSSSTCLNDPVLVTLSDRGENNKTLKLKQVNFMIAISLSKTFTFIFICIRTLYS